MQCYSQQIAVLGWVAEGLGAAVYTDMTKSVSSFSSENLPGVSISIHALEGFAEEESCFTDQKLRENFPFRERIVPVHTSLRIILSFGHLRSLSGYIWSNFRAISSFPLWSLVDNFYPFKESTWVLGFFSHISGRETMVTTWRQWGLALTSDQQPTPKSLSAHL